MKTINKKLAIAVTVALLAFPLTSALTMADTTVSNTTTTAPVTAIPDMTVPTTTASVTANPDTTAEAAVVAYEVAPITTLAEIATAEGLKAAADTAVAAGDVAAKAALELRVTNRAAAIATAKTALQAEAAVVAYEVAPITTLAEVATAEGLKAAADTAIAAGDVAAKAALELRVTNRAAAIATAKTILTPVVDANGNTVTSSTWFTDLVAKLELALTFDPVHKAELNERHALAKLAEAHKLMNDGKLEDAQICLNQYTDKIAQAQAFLAQVKDPTSETAKTLDTALAKVDSNNVQVLSNLIDKLPPQAAQKLALNVVRSMEKAVTKIQKEEAKAALVTTPATTPVITPVIDCKVLEKQAQVALENFKQSLNQKGRVHLEDQDYQNNGDKKVVQQSKPDQEKPELQQNIHQVTQNQSIQTPTQIHSITKSQPTHVTAVPVKIQTAPTFRTSDNNRDDRNKQEDSNKDKGGDTHGDNHQNHK